MPKSIDTKTLILIALTAIAVILTFIRERPIAPRESAEQDTSREEFPVRLVASIIDSTLAGAGLLPEKIRRVKISVGDMKGIREEVRIQVPRNFEILHVMTALGDSLRRFWVSLVSTENLKDKTTSIHLLHDKRVFISIVISKELQPKGTERSATRKQKGTPRKARR